MARSFTLPACLAAALCCAIGIPGQAVEAERDDGIVVLEWGIRQEIQEVIDTLEGQRGPLAERLDAARSLLERHGTRPFFRGDRFAPVSEVITDLLAELGQLEAYQRQFATIAQRALDDAGFDQQALIQVTSQFPRTPAAQEAWQRLADRAWDRGLLGLYLGWAARAGEDEHPLRKERLAAAQRLLSQRSIEELPASLDNLGRMWGASLPSFADNAGRRVSTSPHSTPSANSDGATETLFSRSGRSGLVGMSNGTHLALIDPMVGGLVGTPVRLGSNHLLRPPLISDDGTVLGIGVDEGNRFVLHAATSQGDIQWRRVLTHNANVSTISHAEVLDGVVAVAWEIYDEDGTQLRLSGYALSDGSPRFDLGIAKDTGTIRRRWGRVSDDFQGPQLTTHRGRFAVANGRGLIAMVGADGVLNALWTPRSAAAQHLSGRDFGRGSLHQRSATLLSDGRFLVHADEQGSGLTIIDQDGPTGPRVQRYTGNASADQLVAVDGGRALLVGSRATLIDLDERALLWSSSLPGSGGGQRSGVMGEDHILVVRDTVVSLLAADNGAIIGQRYFPRSASITVASGILLTVRGGDFIGYGDALRFRERLDAAMAADPQDFRPLIALYGLHRASDEWSQAYDYALRALRLGAPARYAEEAASLLRSRMSVRLGRDGVSSELQRLRNLAAFLPVLGQEVRWWEGRHAEQSGDKARAHRIFAELADGPGGLVTLPGGLRADIRALAEAGVARNADEAAPQWLDHRAATSSATVPRRSQDWQVEHSRLGPPLIAGETVVHFADGDLHALRLDNGEALWRRIPSDDDQPMLGVRFRPRDPGVTVDVIPGTAAAAAGFQDRDSIQRLNGEPITHPEELIRIVGGAGVGDPFSAEVIRMDDDGMPQRITLQGRLGVFMIGPVASNSSLLLAQRMVVNDDPSQMQVMPDNQLSQLRLLRLSDGAEVWKRTFPPRAMRSEAWQPLLSDERLLVADGDDLVAYDVSPANNGKAIADTPLWTIPGAAGALRHRSLIGTRFLMLADSDHHLVRLIDLRSGRSLFEVPALGGNSNLLLHGGDLFIQHRDGQLSAWDLGRGIRRWQHDEGNWRLVAVAGDALFAINAQRRLVMLERANGQQRRSLSDFPLVEAVAVHGDMAYVHGRDEQGRQFISGLGLRSGTQLWRRGLPVGCEVRNRPSADAWGVHLELVAMGVDPSLLSLDPDGAVRSVSMPSEGHLLPLANGVLVASPTSLGVRAASLPQKAPALPVVRAASKPTLADQLPDLHDRLAWQELPGARYALVQQGERLAVVLEMTADNRGFTLRIGNQGPEIDPHGQRLSITAGEAPTLSTHPESWRMAAYHRLPDGADGTWKGIVVLTPPALRTVTMNTEVLASTSSAPERGPWWLRQLWRPLVPHEDSSP